VSCIRLILDCINWLCNKIIMHENVEHRQGKHVKVCQKYFSFNFWCLDINSHKKNKGELSGGVLNSSVVITADCFMFIFYCFHLCMWWIKILITFIYTSKLFIYSFTLFTVWQLHTSNKVWPVKRSQTFSLKQAHSSGANEQQNCRRRWNRSAV